MNNIENAISREKRVQLTNNLGPPSFYPMDTVGSFLENKAAGL
jgi:hypothetical protein